MKATILFLFASTAIAQSRTIHITGVEDHTRQDTEPGFSTPLHSKRLTGVLDSKIYRLEEPAVFAHKFEVGKDYPVADVTETKMHIVVNDKRGRQSKERLTIKAVSEK